MSITFEQSVPFFKMQGGGNDFVIIDNRELRLPVERMADWAKKVCARAFGVCADGLFFLENAPEGSEADYIWHFYNSDGSRAEMCGNASRCAGRLAFLLGMAGKEHVLGTDAGLVRAKVLPEINQVKVQLTDPVGQRLNVELTADGEPFTVQFVNTGVPHTVVFVDDLGKVDLPRFGRAIRFHEEFAPAGTNVNFAQVVDKKTMLLRTYERGVEAETYACGTGACACVVLSHALGLTGPEVAVTTTGNETLTIDVSGGHVFLQGGAEITFKGELNLPSLGLEI